MSYFKKYKFDKSQFKLGMRTFKTGIAVFLVLLIFLIFLLYLENQNAIIK